MCMLALVCHYQANHCHYSLSWHPSQNQDLSCLIFDYSASASLDIVLGYKLHGMTAWRGYDLLTLYKKAFYFLSIPACLDIKTLDYNGPTHIVYWPFLYTCSALCCSQTSHCFMELFEAHSKARSVSCAVQGPKETSLNDIMLHICSSEESYLILSEITT